MKNILLLLQFIVITSCGFAQDKLNRKPLSGNIQQDIRALLPSGSYKVDIIDKVVMDTKTKMVMEKFQAAMKNNSEWFLEQQQKVKETGKPIPYDKKLGMTKDEYNYFMDVSKHPERMQMTTSETETITIAYTKDKITFKGTGRLVVFDYLTIDLHNSTAQIGEFDLAKPETVSINSADNGLRSKWKGFTWRYEKANKALENLKSVADYQDLQMKLYKITIGQLESTGKTYIDIKGSETENGQRTVNFHIPIIFQ